MATLTETIESLAGMAAEGNVGDISFLAKLLEGVDEVRAAAHQANCPNMATSADAVGEVLKALIMDAVPDADASFGVVTRAVDVLRGSAGNGDLASFAEFPPELKLAAAPPPSPAELSSGIQHELVDDTILAEFFDQNTSALQEVENLALQLENTQDPEALAGIRRYLHTIKGESGFIGLPQVEKVCHVAENFLEDSSPPYDVEAVLAVIDWLRAALADLSAGRGVARPMEEILSRLERGEAHGTEAAAPESDLVPAPPADNVEHDDRSAEAPTPVAPAASIADGAADRREAHGLPPEGSVVTLSGDTNLLTDFASESLEHLEVANTQLLALEGDAENKEALNSVFRAFHTIKGIASFLELQEILRLAHDSENLLDMVRRGDLALTHEVIDTAFEALDLMGALIGKVKSALESDGTMVADPDLPAMMDRIHAAAEGTIPVKPTPEPTDLRLGDLLVGAGAVTPNEVAEIVEEEHNHPTGKKIGELLVAKAKVPAREVAEALRRQHAPKSEEKQNVELKETIRVDYERLESMVDTIGELVIAEAMITQDEYLLDIKSELLTKKLHNFRMISRKLQELGTTIRMVPIAGTFQKMARLVRDLSKKSGKTITFKTWGEETELDRAYVDKIGDPLVHMIRNSVDHGIEPPQARAEAGKAEAGVIELRAYHEGGNITIEIRDDGRGINKDAVRAKGIERGLITEEDRLTDQEIYQLIFAPGFSTAAQVTEVSGRGVGMDVVRRNIEELRGQIHITSELGQGTVFKLVLPLTLALIDGMLVRVGTERYIVPVMSVVESFRPDTSMLHSMLGRGEMISLRDRQLPFFRLSQLFSLPNGNHGVDSGLVVVVENEGREMGLLVDELLGLQQTVIKNLGSGMGEKEGLAGGAIMADGRIGLILDVPGLFKVAKARA